MHVPLTSSMGSLQFRALLVCAQGCAAPLGDCSHCRAESRVPRPPFVISVADLPPSILSYSGAFGPQDWVWYRM